MKPDCVKTFIVLISSGRVALPSVDGGATAGRAGWIRAVQCVLPCCLYKVMHWSPARCAVE